MLRAPVFSESWQNEVAEAAANTAFAILAEVPSVASAVALARAVMASMSRLAEGMLARAPAGAVACRRGCDHCCHQSVSVTPPEALAIVEHLQQKARPALARLVARVGDLHLRTAGLSAAKRFSPEFPCPLLEDGGCVAYEVRPLSCRGMNALDAADCATRLRDPEARAAFVEAGFGGRVFIDPIRGAHAISAGVQLALSEIYHLDMRPLDLTAALTMLFRDPVAVRQRWVDGHRVFDEARGGDGLGVSGAGGEVSGAGEDGSSTAC